MLPNRVEALLATLLFSNHCTFAPIPTNLSKAEIAFELDDIPAHALVVQRGADNEKALQVARQRSIPVLELVQDENMVGLFTLAWLEEPEPAGVTLEAKEKESTIEPAALILHTSGSTARPKVVPLTHHSLGLGSLAVADILGISAEAVCINVMPLFHAHAICACALTSLVAGATLVATPGFTAKSFFDWALSNSVTWYSAVPTMHQKLSEVAEEAASLGKPLRHSIQFARNCSAALLPSVAMRLESALGVLALPTYAMTEAMPIASNLKTKRCLDSVGGSSGPEIAIARRPESMLRQAPDGNTGSPCVIDEEGEVCVRGPYVIRGYELREGADDPNELSFYDKLEGQSVGDRWLRTGDKGYINENGHVVLSGRFKEIVNRSGEKISPMVVENVLRSHPAFSDIVCFAADHIELGETVAAAVVLHRGVDCPTLENVRSLGLKSLSLRWCPELLVVVPEIQLGRTGKPKRIGLGAALKIPPLGKSHKLQRLLFIPGDEDDPCPRLVEIHDEAKRIHRNDNLGTVDIIRRAWQEVLGLPLEEIELHTPFAALGGDSLLAMKVSALIESRRIVLSKEISARMEDHTLSSLAQAVDSIRDGKSASGVRKLHILERDSRYNKSQLVNLGGLSACAAGNMQIAMQKYEQGSWNPHYAADKLGNTALMWVSGGGYLEFCEWLVAEVGVGVDVVNKDGRTALMWACKNGRFPVAKYLLGSAGADPTIRMKDESTAFDWAVVGGDISTMELLAEDPRVDMDAMNRFGCAAVQWAAASGSIETCRWLLSKGLNFLHINDVKHGAIVKAAWKGHTELLKWLLLDSEGPQLVEQLTLTDLEGRLPSELARMNGQHDAATFLDSLHP